MKKRHYILISLLLTFTAWLLTGNFYKDTENKPIKKRIQKTGIFLFGMRNIWTISSNIEIYNRKGQIIEDQVFYNGNSCESKYIYKYNEFDSLQKVIWLTGKDLTPQKIEIYHYDNNKRPVQQLVYEISKLKPDTFMCEKTTWFYNDENRKYKTIITHYSKEYPSSAGITTMIDSFNEHGLVVADTFKSTSGVYITNYTYDISGHIKTKFGGLTNDSIHYKTNKKGQIIEEMEKSNDFISQHNKYWYDQNGNKIKTDLEIDNGRTYTFKYDKHNRILKERLSGNFLYILMAFNEYSYEYFE